MVQQDTPFGMLALPAAPGMMPMNQPMGGMGMMNQPMGMPNQPMPSMGGQMNQNNDFIF